MWQRQTERETEREEKMFFKKRTSLLKKDVKGKNSQNTSLNKKLLLWGKGQKEKSLRENDFRNMTQVKTLVPTWHENLYFFGPVEYYRELG